MGLADLKILIPTCRHDYYEDVEVQRYKSLARPNLMSLASQTCQR